MIVTGSNVDEVDCLLKVLGNEFKVHGLAKLSYFLGIQVRRTHGDLFLSQQRYLVDLLHSSKLDNLRPSTPMDVNVNFSSDDVLFNVLQNIDVLWGRSNTCYLPGLI